MPSKPTQYHVHATRTSWSLLHEYLLLPICTCLYANWWNWGFHTERDGYIYMVRFSGRGGALLILALYISRNTS